MIGKGKRTQDVMDAIVRNGCVYFAAVGGAGALLSKCIKRSEVIAYDDLGTEAIRRLEERMDLTELGEKLYETARLRLENPELTLSQLAELCDPPVTKSCLNHRLRKLLALSQAGDGGQARPEA